MIVRLVTTPVIIDLLYTFNAIPNPFNKFVSFFVV